MAYLDKVSLGGTLYDVTDTKGRAMIAPKEATSTASAAHTAGSYFTYNDLLYMATADISSGGTITPGTNCAAVAKGVSEQVAKNTNSIENIIMMSGIRQDATTLFTFTNGYAVYYNTGAKGNSSTLAYSNYVEVPAWCSKIVFQGVVRPSRVLTGCAFYTAANEASFIADSGKMNTINTNQSGYSAEETSVAVPNGAKYFRTNWLATTNSAYANYTFSCHFVHEGEIDKKLYPLDYLDGTINVLHDLVNYGYDTPIDAIASTSSTGATALGVKREGPIITLNKDHASSSAIRCLVSGNTYMRTQENSTVDGWSQYAMAFTEGHKYKVYLTALSGEATGVDISVSVYRAGEHASVGTYVYTSNGFQRVFTAEAGTSYLLALYVPAAAILTDYKIALYMEDITGKNESDEELLQKYPMTYEAKTLSSADFLQGYWNADGTRTDSNKVISLNKIPLLHRGDVIIYTANAVPMTIWAKSENDEAYVNVVPYTSNSHGVYAIENDTLVILHMQVSSGTLAPSGYDANITIYRSRINAVQENVDLETLHRTHDELYLGTFVRAAGAANGIQSATTRLVMKNSLALPHAGKTKLTVRINRAYKILMRVGTTPYDLDTNLYFYNDGDTIPVPATANYYRVAIAKQDHGADISMDELATANLHIYYERSDSDFAPFDAAANAAMLYAPSGSSNMCYRSLPLFVHTSDVHGDYERVRRFNQFAERIGATMACITGDMVGYNINTDSNHFEWLHDIIKKSGVQYGICVGNHDSHVGKGSGSYTMADADLYPLFYEPIKTELGNETEELWYVKDLTSEKLRIISLDLYQAGGVWTYTYFTEEQLTWLCTTLASTPQDYGVIILMHAQQRTVVKDNDHAKFYQTLRKGESPEHYNAVDNDGDPIGDIVNAFINGTTISATYTQNSGAETLTVSADFTSLATGVEFICYMTGHFHQDTIGYNTRPEGDPKQLILNVTCGCSMYGMGNYKYLADCSDIPRNPKDATQDAFNVYGIDRANKAIRVARVGSTINYEYAMRDYMIIPYAD